MKRFAFTATAAFAALAIAPSAFAVVLNYGTPMTATPGSICNVAGLLAQQFIPFTGINALGQIRFTGTLINEVYVMGDGTLTFAYLLKNDATSKASLSEMATTGFGGWFVDADWATNTNQTPPFGPSTRASSMADRSDATDKGDIVGFYFVSGLGGKVAPGDNCYVNYIHTNATAFNDQGTTNLIDGAITTVQTYAPVPEPASILALGLGAAALIRRRRNS